MRSTQYYHSLRFKTVIEFWVGLSTGADRIKIYKLNITIIGLLNCFLFQIVRKHVYEIKLLHTYHYKAYLNYRRLIKTFLSQKKSRYLIIQLEFNR